MATVAAFLRCPHSALNPCHCITTVSCTKHLFGHLRTMMTRANSLHAREAGRPINVSVTRARGPGPTRAFPHGHRAYDCRARPRRQNSA